ncbi:uncharacterized protein LOC112521827 [Cynara cardunculus var. scolymus]|uniref:uncharacterized protein LOC112521827 n=1 Tax=Cynara cardunculus var. scolymus TaxID=59895 RepID=UPI000D624934|nr:uncharacterized protein LOC112521827 [Cynara cardunculus var. scolymus]
MEEDFLNLEQGNRYVKDYTEKFIQYSRFAEHYISTESRKVERYIWGLKSSIREFVIAMNPTTFTSIVDAAEVTERNKNKQEEGKVIEKRRWEGPAAGYRGPKTMKYTSNQRSMQKFNKKPCPKCRKIHQGECRMEPKKCFKCGSVGHLLNNCPTVKRCYNCNSTDHLRPNFPKMNVPQLTIGNITSSGQVRLGTSKGATGGVRGRSFHMIKLEAETVPDVVTGTFLINSLDAKVLFDSGENFSFVSPSFAQHAKMNYVPLDDRLVVDTANGQVCVKSVFNNCSI